MRVVLLQISLDPKSRSANVQHINAVIDEAAAADPPPDLLVLPGACDTGGATPDSGWSEVSSEAMTANLSSKAREWGVYMAAGGHFRRDQDVLPCSLLFDPDGDVTGRTAHDHPIDEPKTASPIESWPTPVGRMAVLDSFAAPPLSQWVDQGGVGVLLALPTSRGWTGVRRRRMNDNIEALRSGSQRVSGTYFAFVAEACAKVAAESAPATFLCAPDGGIIARVEGDEEAILHVQVRFG